MSQELKPIKGSGWLWFIGVVIIVIGFSYKILQEREISKSNKIDSNTTQKQEKWYLCSEKYWEKKERKDFECTNIVRLKITDDSLNFVYVILRRNNQFGEFSGKSDDGMIYTGTWYTVDDRGTFYLKKISDVLYNGWATANLYYDDKIKLQLSKSPSIY